MCVNKHVHLLHACFSWSLQDVRWQHKSPHVLPLVGWWWWSICPAEEEML